MYSDLLKDNYENTSKIMEQIDQLEIKLNKIKSNINLSEFEIFKLSLKDEINSKINNNQNIIKSLKEELNINKGSKYSNEMNIDFNNLIDNKLSLKNINFEIDKISKKSTIENRESAINKISNGNYYSLKNDLLKIKNDILNLSKKSNLTQKDTEIISKMRKDKEEIETKIDGLSFKNLNNQDKNKVIRLEKQMEKFYKDKINTLHYQKLNLEKEIEFCEYKIDKNSNRDVNLYINNMNEFISSKNEEKKLIELEIEKIKNSNSLENLERMTLDKLNGNDSYTTMMMSYINLDKIIKEKELASQEKSFFSKIKEKGDIN